MLPAANREPDTILFLLKVDLLYPMFYSDQILHVNSSLVNDVANSNSNQFFLYLVHRPCTQYDTKER